MDPTNKEILRMLQELIGINDRELAERYDRMIQTIDSCVTTGGTAPSSSSSARSDVSSVAEVPTPASPNPMAEGPTPASSVSDAKLVTIDVDGPAAAAWTTRSGDPSCDTTDSRSAPAPTTAPTGHRTTVDVAPVLAALAATDGTPVGQAISGVASTPATCSTDCLPQQPIASPELIVSSPSTLSKYCFNTNCISMVAVHPPLTGVCPAVLSPLIQMQQLYGDNEIHKPSSTQHITNKVPLHRPMPWPSLLNVRPNGDEAWPLPWPSFREINDGDFPSKFVEKTFGQCSSNSFRAEGCVSIELQMSDFFGNLVTSTGYIITHDLCNSWEWSCLDDVLLFVEHCGSASDFVQRAHTHHSIVWLSCTMSGFHWLTMVRSLELKLGSAFLMCSTVLMDSSNFAALTCKYLGVDTTACSVLWLLAGCLLAVCRKSLVQSSADCYSVLENVAGLLGTVDWPLMDSHCRTAATVGLSCPEQANHYFCCSELKESVVLIILRSSSCSLIWDEWVLSPWDPGQAVVPDFTNIFYSHATVDIYLQKLMLQSLNESGSDGSLSLVLLVSSGYNRTLTKSVVLNLLRKSSSYVPYDRLLLLLGNSGQHVNSPYYQFCCAIRSTSCLPENRVTGGQLQVTISCSAIRLLLSVFLACFCLVVMPELKLFRIGSQSVYLQKLKMDTSELEGAAMYSISINGNCCQLKWREAVGMVMYCSSFSCAREGTSYESTLAPVIYSVAWTNLCFSNSKQCASVVGFLILKGVRIKYAMSNKDVSTNTGPMGLGYKNFLGVYAPTQAGRISYCPCTASYSQQNTLYMLACGLLFLQNQESEHGMVGSDKGLYPGHVRLSQSFVLMPMLIEWPPSVHIKVITNELAGEDIESHCFLGLYNGGPALFLFLAFDRQVVFQGGRSAILRVVHYLAYDSYVNNLHYLNSDGPKVLQVSGNPSVPNVALYAALQEVQLHIPWDLRTQSFSVLRLRLGVKPCFKEGGVSGTLPILVMGLGLDNAGAGVMGLSPPISYDDKDYKYRAYRNERTIQTDHDEPALSLSSVSLLPCPCFSVLLP